MYFKFAAEFYETFTAKCPKSRCFTFCVSLHTKVSFSENAYTTWSRYVNEGM